MNTSTKSVVTDKLAALADLEAKRTALQTEIENTRTTELRALHESFGYETPAEFLSAYHVALSIRGGKKAKKNGKSATKPASDGRKPRTTITPEKREEIKKFFKNNGATMEAMTKFDISIATAQSIKKEAGMVNER